MFFRKKKPKKPKKLSSIAFVIAIPANFLLGSICLLASLNILVSGHYRMPQVIAFFSAFVVAVLLARALTLSRLRVFLHESKHALVVLMTGNVVKGFSVQHSEGQVEYQLYKDRLQYGPFITLAPYCLPLFAIPAFIAAFFLDGDPNLGLAACVILGLALGIDFETAFHDLHPKQTDFQQIIGGFFASGLYIASVLFFSGNACVLLALAGRQGLLAALYVAIGLGLGFAERLPGLLRKGFVSLGKP